MRKNREREERSAPEASVLNPLYIFANVKVKTPCRRCTVLLFSHSHYNTQNFTHALYISVYLAWDIASIHVSECVFSCRKYNSAERIDSDSGIRKILSLSKFEKYYVTYKLFLNDLTCSGSGNLKIIEYIRYICIISPAECVRVSVFNSPNSRFDGSGLKHAHKRGKP